MVEQMDTHREPRHMLTPAGLWTRRSPLGLDRRRPNLATNMLLHHGMRSDLALRLAPQIVLISLCASLCQHRAYPQRLLCASDRP